MKVLAKESVLSQAGELASAFYILCHGRIRFQDADGRVLMDSSKTGLMVLGYTI